MRILIYALIVFTAIATFVAAQVLIYQADLWLNLFAEAVGVAFTVLIIETLIRRHEQRRTKPAGAAAFRDAQLVYGRFYSLWYEMIKAAFDPVRDGSIVEDKDIKLLDARFGDITAFLNLESDAPVVPGRNWRVHLKQRVEEIEQRIDRCLQRYAAFMEPDLIHALQAMEHTSFNLYSKLIVLSPQSTKNWG